MEIKSGTEYSVSRDKRKAEKGTRGREDGGGGLQFVKRDIATAEKGKLLAKSVNVEIGRARGGGCGEGERGRVDCRFPWVHLHLRSTVVTYN